MCSDAMPLERLCAEIRECLLRFEDWFVKNGSPNVSNDSLRFTVYAGEATSEPEPQPQPQPQPQPEPQPQPQPLP